MVNLRRPFICANRVTAVLVLALSASSCLRTQEEKSEAWIRSADTSIQRKDYERAVIELLNAVEGTPKKARAHYLLGQALLLGGHTGRAVQSFKTAADLEPTLTDAHLKVAQLLNDMPGNTLLLLANQHAQAALQQRPNDPEVLHALAVSELRQGHSEAATSHLKQALGFNPGHVKALTTLALVQLSVEKNPATAEQTLHDAVERSQSSTPALIALGQFYTLTGRTVAAEAQYRAVLAVDPGSGQALFELARLQQSSGKLAEAEQTLNRLSSLSDRTFRSFHALFLLQNGQPDAAIAELKRRWANDANDIEIRSRLVDAYFQTNKLGEAETVLTAALKRNARDGEALAQQGQMYLRRQRYQDAEKSLRSALQLLPDSARTHYDLAQARRYQGDTQEFHKELRHALEIDPALAKARLELSEGLRNTNKLREALEVLDAAPDSDKEQPTYLIERGWVLLALGRNPEAKAIASSVLTSGRTPAALIQSGLAELQDKHYEKARTSLEEALKATPANMEALKAIAYSLALEHKVAAAVERVRKQAAMAPQSAEVQFLLGYWLEQVGDLAGARSAYSAALTADPAHSPSSVAAARIDMMQGRVEDARTRVQGVLGKDPRNVDALLALGMLEEGTGRNDAAIHAYRKILQIDSTHVIAKNNLAARLSDSPATLDEAFLLARDANQALPGNPEIADTLGWIYCRLGQYRTALKPLQDAASQTNSGRVKYHLAIAYFGAGDRNRGLTALAAARKLDPGLPEAAMAQKMADSVR